MSESTLEDARDSKQDNEAQTQVEPAPAQNAVTLPSPLSFRWLLLLFVVFRMLALFLLRPGGFIRDWSDFDTLFGIAATSDQGLYPFLGYWLEWPPLVAWLAVAAYKLSLFFPPWPDDARLWFVLILGSVFVLFEAGNLALVYRIARRLYHQVLAEMNPDQAPDPAQVTELAMRPAWIYALLFVPLYTMLGFFDAIPLFFLLLALHLLLRGKLLSSAISTGVGFAVKLTPIIFLPVALRRLWDEAENWQSAVRDGALYVVTSLLAILVLFLPFLLTQPNWLLTSARSIAGRSSWETVWAVMEGYLGFGAVGGDRLNPAETAFAIHESTLPWLLITLVFGIIYLVVWTRPADYLRSRNVVALTGFTVTLFLFYSKGFSPQFLVYLLPFIILLFPDRRGVTYSLLLTLLNVLEQPVFFVLVPGAKTLLVAVLIARWLILAALLLEFVLEIWKPKLPALIQVRRYAPLGLSVVVGLALVIAIPFLGRSYADRMLDQDPAAPLISFLQSPQAQAEADVLLVSDQETLRRVFPYLGTKYRIRLLDDERLAGLEDSGRLWVFIDPSGPQAISVLPPDTTRANLTLLTYEFGDQHSLELLGMHPEMTSLPPAARLGSGATLLGYKIEHPAPRQLLVTLYWWATISPRQSYTAFTQVLDANGSFVAGHDSIPADGQSPTYTWKRGYVYADQHLIELPPGLTPGKYRIVAGMYDVNQERVYAGNPDGTEFLDRAVPLEEIRLP